MSDQSISDLQEKLAGQSLGGNRFGTFVGVFTPSLLTILGVILYLREGWVVGNAGLLGAWLVILLACSITTFTGLAMSPKEVASPETGEPPAVDPNGYSRPPRKAKPQAVKGGKVDSPMQGIGKK